MDFVSQFIRGLRIYWEGVRWLKRHPKYFLLLLIPSFFGFLIAGSVFALFIEYDNSIFNYMLFEPKVGFFWEALRSVLKVLVSFIIAGLSLLFGFLISNILSVPIYDIVSAAVERDITGKISGISLWESIKLIPEEIKKVCAILAISLLLLIIPGVNFLAIFVTGFLIGWDFYDYPLARRGWTFKRRLQYVAKDKWSVAGLGLWLTIPFIQLLLYPFTVVGGTLLNLERLESEKLIARV